MKEQRGVGENDAPLEPNSKTPGYDLAAFCKENEEVRDVLHHVRYDVDSCDTLMDGDLDPQLAERLSRDIALLVGVFLHYSRKEQLVMPCLEQHLGNGSDNTHEETDAPTTDAKPEAGSKPGAGDELKASNSSEAGNGPSTAALTNAAAAVWENDNRVRGVMAMAASLMPGAEERPSAGNLQSVASQLAEACDAVETIANDEKTSLVPFMKETLNAADWTLIAEGLSSVKSPKVEDGSTWGPGPLDMAEARLRASQLRRDAK